MQEKVLCLMSKLIKNRANIAGKQLNSIICLQKKEQAKLNTLVFYKDDYLQKLKSKENMHMSHTELSKYYAFIDNLYAAIEKQQQIMTKISQDLTNSREQWIRIHNQSESMQKYLKSIQDQSLTKKLSQEQKELDAIVTDNLEHYFKNK